MINLEMYRGDTPYWDFTLTGPDGNVLNPTGATIWFTAKKSRASADNQAVFQKKTGGFGITITDAPAGKIRVTLATTDTSALTGKPVLEWDLQVKDVANGVYTLADGTLTVKPDVTVSTS